MKYLIIFFTLTLSLLSYAQEGVSPLTTNPSLYKKQIPFAKSGNTASFDSTIVYLTDTLSLPFFDDFSRDKFQKYDAEIGVDPMGDTVYYKMLNENDSTPLADTGYTSTKTYVSTYDPVQDTTVISYFDSTRFLYANLIHFPPSYTSSYGYPAYIVYDTLGGGNLGDTVFLSEVEYIQDSARIFFDTINDPGSLWLNQEAYRNYRFAINPWSLGVVTFDGLDADGYPYNFNSPFNAVADTLLAKPLDLSSNAPADSIYFSFLYQEGGYGDAPESSDSLYLDFYSPITETWHRVWRAGGGGATDVFNVAHIPIKDPSYFGKGFQFRFMNYGSVAGAIDQFHIDFVNVRTMSGYQDTLFKDFAWVYPISTLLNDFTSVPWKHYKNNPSGKMSDSVKVTVRNGSELTENNQNGAVNVYHEGTLVGNFMLNASDLSGGGINYAPRTVYTSYHDFSGGYSFDPSTNDTMAIFDYEGIATAQFPNDPINDTAFSRQLFKNYYAYDDGTAEKAYGITGEQALLAVKFDAYQPDTLVAVQIHFVPSVVDVSNNLFLLTVWDDNNGEPGDTLYQDLFYYPQQPKYTWGRNKYATYYFKDTQRVAVGQTFYVGMRQIDEERLNIGFDMNNDNADKIFWSIDGGGNWYHSNFPGTVMIRPVISSNLNYTLGVKNEIINKKSFDFTMYPNPANDILHFKANAEIDAYEIRDIDGRRILSVENQQSVDVSALEAGIYLVIGKVKGHPVQTKKLVVVR